MNTEWTKTDRADWWQNGPWHYEYQAEKPEAPYWVDRRAKACIHMNINMTHWFLDRIKWLSKTAFMPVPLGKFPPDDLNSAMATAEQAVAQLSLFAPKPPKNRGPESHDNQRKPLKA